ncbi:MAG: hypothetical protein P4M14_12035 [Gammaproteobacteria bacterium]|nr:hypothetical protein [Gammaproteobacteria bacterium]
MTTVTVDGNKLGRSDNPERIYTFLGELSRELYIEASKTPSHEKFVIEITNLQLDFILCINRELPNLDHDIDCLVLAQLPLESLIILMKPVNAKVATSDRFANSKIKSIDMQNIQLTDIERNILFSYMAPHQHTVAFLLPETWQNPFVAYYKSHETYHADSAHSASAKRKEISTSPKPAAAAAASSSFQVVSDEKASEVTKSQIDQAGLFAHKKSKSEGIGTELLESIKAGNAEKVSAIVGSNAAVAKQLIPGDSGNTFFMHAMQQSHANTAAIIAALLTEDLLSISTLEELLHLTNKDGSCAMKLAIDHENVETLKAGIATVALSAGKKPDDLIALIDRAKQQLLQKKQGLFS